jgi:hypothetical protein
LKLGTLSRRGRLLDDRLLVFTKGDEMESQRMKNALLFVIALCLVLIVVRLYSSVDFIKEAQAQSTGGETHLYGCQLFRGAGNLPECNWTPVRVNGGGDIVTVPGPSHGPGKLGK